MGNMMENKFEINKFNLQMKIMDDCHTLKKKKASELKGQTFCLCQLRQQFITFLCFWFIC